MIDQNVPCHPDYSPRFLELFPIIDQIAKWNLKILFKLPTINQLVFFRSFIFKSCERVINYSIVAIIADMCPFYAKLFFDTFDFWNDLYPLNFMRFARTKFYNSRQLNSFGLATIWY